MKKTIKCPECEGKGYIPWGDKNDEIDECEVCEGHGEWLEDNKIVDEVSIDYRKDMIKKEKWEPYWWDEEEMDKIYPQITDDEIEVMYEDFHGVIEAVEEYKRNDKNYRYA